MKKRMFSLLICLAFISSTVLAKDTDRFYTCPTCHVTTDMLRPPYQAAHDGVLHIKLAWKSFTNWFNSISNPFDLNG
jgi:hypothetical protein